ncbi:MAG: hypothetical protein WDN24_22320 [Sphingomonas sp.]
MTIGRQLAEAAGGRPDRRALAAMLDRVGLSDPEAKLDAFPHRLSGGERQRALIACATAHGPPPARRRRADQRARRRAAPRGPRPAGKAARAGAGAAAGEP